MESAVQRLGALSAAAAGLAKSFTLVAKSAVRAGLSEIAIQAVKAAFAEQGAVHAVDSAIQKGDTVGTFVTVAAVTTAVLFASAAVFAIEAGVTLAAVIAVGATGYAIHAMLAAFQDGDTFAASVAVLAHFAVRALFTSAAVVAVFNVSIAFYAAVAVRALAIGAANLTVITTAVDFAGAVFTQAAAAAQLYTGAVYAGIATLAEQKAIIIAFPASSAIVAAGSTVAAMLSALIECYTAVTGTAVVAVMLLVAGFPGFFSVMVTT